MGDGGGCKVRTDKDIGRQNLELSTDTQHRHGGVMCLQIPPADGKDIPTRCVPILERNQNTKQPRAGRTGQQRGVDCASGMFDTDIKGGGGELREKKETRDG